MKPRDALAFLLDRNAECCDLGGAAALLSWDQQTFLPPRGAEARARQLSTLAALRHERFTDPRVGDAILLCESSPGEFDDEESAALRQLRRDFDRITRLPRELVRELARASSEAQQIWKEVRPRGDFPRFVPVLRRLLSLTRERAEALGYAETPYDALVDTYERGATTRSVASLFEQLREELVPLVDEVLPQRQRVDARCLRGDFPESQQAAFGLAVIRALGFDLAAGRVDLAAHPFCTTVGAGDTRLTRRFVPDDLRPGLFGIIHEAGHGLYEQGLPARWQRHPLGEPASVGVHESQSRLWENLVARSRPFWEHFLPVLREHFPRRFRNVSAEEIFRAVNEVNASLIRVEADELTYNLHVILRFDLERRLFRDELQVEDLPGEWNAGMKDLLGVVPPDDRDGCLQDIHWSLGAFGYFPTYALGNLYAAQFFETLRQDVPQLDEQVRGGDFQGVLEWLRGKIHSQGRLHDPSELVRRVTGESLSTAPFLRHLRRRMEEVYGA